MSRGESFCLGGPSIWMSDVFIEEWLAPRKSRWILHSAFKSNGMQMSGFRAVPWLLLLSWPQASASWACLYSTLSFLLVVLPHVLRKQFRFKSCTCYLSLRTKRLKQKSFIILDAANHSGLEKGQRESENLVLRCSEIMRSCCSIEPAVVLLNVQIPLSRIQQPLRKSLIYWSKHIRPLTALSIDCGTSIQHRKAYRQKAFKWEVNVTFRSVN